MPTRHSTISVLECTTLTTNSPPEGQHLLTSCQSHQRNKLVTFLNQFQGVPTLSFFIAKVRFPSPPVSRSSTLIPSTTRRSRLFSKRS
jgi:hypothetical protein